MTTDGVQLGNGVSSELESFITGLYKKGPTFGLTRECFGAILTEIGAKYLPSGASFHDAIDLFSSLRIEDLALARACAAGHEPAWEIFMARYREKLYDIGAYIAKETSAARELADSLYAELYGTKTREGERVSKLASYTGRGSLEGWLRTVMAQEFVNRYRRQRRLVSLEEETEDGKEFAAKEAEPMIAVDARVEAATDEILSQLRPEDRFVLASYYLDGRTLAEIARTLGVHESTISRRVDKLAKSVRKQILSALVRKGLSRRQAEDALDVDVRDLRLNFQDWRVQESGSRTFHGKEGNPESPSQPQASGVEPDQ